MDVAETHPPSEREKWEADIRLRERELEIKAAEQAANAAEQKRSRFANPLVVAVFAAAIAAGGNAWVAWFNGSAQRELERAKNQAEAELERYRTTAQLSVEETKGESARILEMLKTTDPDKAATNLEFLLKTGLIGNEKRKENLTKYLAERKPGQGPSLSSGEMVQSTRVYFTDECTAKPGLDNLSAVAAALQRSVNRPGSQYELLVANESLLPEFFISMRLKVKISQDTVMSPTISKGLPILNSSSFGIDLDTSISDRPVHFGPIINALKDVVTDPRCVKPRQVISEHGKAIARDL